MAREKSPEAAPAAKRAPRKRGSVADTGSEAVLPNFVDPQRRAALIARAAYFRALQRGFEPGQETSDWLAAEVEVDAELLSGTSESSSA